MTVKTIIRRLADAHFAITGEHVYSGQDADGRHMFTDAVIMGDNAARWHMIATLNHGVTMAMFDESRTTGNHL